jgi:hypothetical protein
MKRKYLIIAASVLVWSAGAQAKPELTTEAAQDVNFAQYKSYAWVKIHPAPGMNSVQYQRIQADLEARMAAKGYQKAVPADLTLARTIGKRQKIDIDTWNRYGYEHDRSYTEGQVSLDAFDTKTKKAVWHGQVTDTVTPGKPDPDKLVAALEKLMEQFPATAAQ